MRLNLGCSDAMHQGWTNVDIFQPSDEALRKSGGDFQQSDLSLPWPWEDSSIEEIRAADIFEHIGNCEHIVPSRFTRVQVCQRCDPSAVICGGRYRHWSGRIHVMNEAHRALQPGGYLTIECPDAAKGAGQWQDPTHVTPWTPNGLQYFVDGSGAHTRFAKAYGITARFKLLSCTERMYEESVGPHVRAQVWKFTAVLECVK